MSEVGKRGHAKGFGNSGKGEGRKKIKQLKDAKEGETAREGETGK